MSDAKAYYCLDFGTLPDELYNPDASTVEWRKHCTSVGEQGFEPGSLTSIAPISTKRLLERLIDYPIYMIMNAAPFMMPPLLWAAFGTKGVFSFVGGLAALHVLLIATNPMKTAKQGQYIFSERNIQLYNSMKWVWPASLEPPNTPGPKIFCTIPHGLAPVGITAYPAWSRLFGDRLNHPTAAPAVLKLPVISYILRMVGYIPAVTKDIKKALHNDESVGIVLDGIAGMFQNDPTTELGWVQERKGVVKIALTTGTPMVPIFGFGHSQLWRILVDPFGILKKISLTLGVSVTPFCGRPFGLLPFGPPYRTPILMAFGDPIMVPKVENPTKEQIAEYHAKLMEGFLSAFDTHKAAYGWQERNLKLV